MLIRRLILLAILAAVPLRAVAQEIAHDLAADGAVAEKRGQVLVILYSADWCRWCDAVKQEHFQFLESDRRYHDRIIVREVVIDSTSQLTGFDGALGTHREFADASGVSLVPHARFVDGSGTGLAPPLVGVAGIDFYGWYLDQRIRQAVDAVAPNATEKERG